MSWAYIAFYVECCPVWNQPKKSLKKKKKKRKDGHGIPILGDKGQKNKSCRQQQQILSIRLGGAKANEYIAEEDGTWLESGYGSDTDYAERPLKARAPVQQSPD